MKHEFKGMTDDVWEAKWNGNNITVGTPSSSDNRQHDYLVCSTDGNSLCDQANAQLIATAPELLAALQGYIAHYESSKPGTVEEFQSMLDSIRAAIQKATTVGRGGYFLRELNPETV